MTTKNQTDSDGTGKKETPASRARGRGFFFCLCRSGRAFAARPLRSEFVADGSAIGARLARIARDAARLRDRREDRRQILGMGEVTAPHADVDAVGLAHRERRVEDRTSGE